MNNDIDDVNPDGSTAVPAASDPRTDRGAGHEEGTGSSHPDGRVKETATLTVIPPSIPRDEAGDGSRVGAAAYPYRVSKASVTMERPLVEDRTDEFIVSVDRSRRLAVRADVVPDTVERTVEDVLVIPPEIDDGTADAIAQKSVFQWTLRRYSLNHAPTIEFEDAVEAYKLFWIVERPDGDVIIDSVRGDERSLEE
jgi:hypothetical protein